MFYSRSWWKIVGLGLIGVRSLVGVAWTLRLAGLGFNEKSKYYPTRWFTYASARWAHGHAPLKWWFWRHWNVGKGLVVSRCWRVHHWASLELFIGHNVRNFCFGSFQASLATVATAFLKQQKAHYAEHVDRDQEQRSVKWWIHDCCPDSVQIFFLFTFHNPSTGEFRVLDDGSVASGTIAIWVLSRKVQKKHLQLS